MKRLTLGISARIQRLESMAIKSVQLERSKGYEEGLEVWLKHDTEACELLKTLYRYCISSSISIYTEGAALEAFIKSDKKAFALYQKIEERKIAYIKFKSNQMNNFGEV